MDLATRRVHFAGCTTNPDEGWMLQVARNLTDAEEGFLRGKKYLQVDVLKCDHCGGRMRILASIHSSDAIRGILDCLGLPSMAPPIAPAADEPESCHMWLP